MLRTLRTLDADHGAFSLTGVHKFCWPARASDRSPTEANPLHEKHAKEIAA